MQILTDKKTKKAECPKCGEWKEAIYNQTLNYMEFTCCGKTWSLMEMPIVKPKSKFRRRGMT